MYHLHCFGLQIAFLLKAKSKNNIQIKRIHSPATPATKKKIDKSRLNELDSSTLVELIKDYMGENQSLRRENGDLFSVRDMMLRFHTLTV